MGGGTEKNFQLWEEARVRRISRKGERRTPKVLVADPREVDLERTSRALEASGFKVASLARTDALIPLATAFRPHGVVIATRAPEFASVEVARRLHQQTRGTVPILYLVDAPDPELRRYCLLKGHGVDALSRPLDELELVAKVANWLRHDEAVERAGRTANDLRGPSLRDPLTSTFNRRFLLALIAQETRRGERYGGSFSLVAGRLDGFRALRRDVGRELADRLLVYASVLLTQTMREADAVARVGDEEFAVFLPGTPEEALPPLRVRLAQRFHRARFELDGRWVRPVMTFGTASFPDVVGTPIQLLSAAFEDLKRSKDGAKLGPTRLTI